MANFGNYPPNYLLFNQQLSKSLSIVMKIEGIPLIFGSSDTFQTVRYGDPGIVYGTPGLVYGGLRRIGGPNGTGGVQPWIVLDSGMIIQQRIEPEQGKGNIGTLNMTLIDYQGQVSNFITPGNVVDEIMCSKQVTIFLGFQQSSYPEDYLIIYRGYITSLDCPPAIVRFQISDGTMKSRQPICDTPSTNTTTPIDSVQTTIPVLATGGFYSHILGPDGTYASTVHTFIKIDDEYMAYGPSGITGPTSFSVTRGSLGSLASTHDEDTQVTNVIQFGLDAPGQGVNFITLALQILLSGWNGPCETDIALASLGFAGVTNPNSFVLSSDDAQLDLGLTVGDYFSISGASNLSNNVNGVITGLTTLPGGVSPFTVVIETDQTFIVENPTTATASFRSKYDVLPVAAGSQCRMRDVDVETMEFVKQSYFNSTSNVAMFYDSPLFAKDTVAQDLFLPFGCYQISRFGRISISVTKPPLPGIGNLIQLDWTNVIDPDKILVTRATNNRTFYNQISYEYDFDPNSGDFGSIQYFVDTNSLNLFNQTLSLPIQAKALKTNLDGGIIAASRGAALLNRYKNVAIIIELTVNWSVGSLIEVSDVALLVDNGTLKIMNFETGQRNLGSQLFEVIDRTFNVTKGNVKLKLLSGLGFSANSRFGLVSPSTILGMGTTATSLKLTPSYGQTTISGEISKWSPFFGFGLGIVVHSRDYSFYETGTLIGIDPSDVTSLQVTGLGSTPSPGMIVEIATYPLDTNPHTFSQYKALYCYITPTVAIVSGISSTQFTVSPSDISKFIQGNLLITRKNDWTNYSPEVTISVVDSGTNTITVSKSLGYTPDNTYLVEGLGFPDGTGYYRYD